MLPPTPPVPAMRYFRLLFVICSVLVWLMSLYVESEVHDVSVLHYIFLAFHT